jgi:hypothetical protein
MWNWQKIIIFRIEIINDKKDELGWETFVVF